MRHLIVLTLGVSLVVAACDSNPTSSDGEANIPVDPGYVALALAASGGDDQLLGNGEFLELSPWLAGGSNGSGGPTLGVVGISGLVSRSAPASLRLSAPAAGSGGVFSYALQMTRISDPVGKKFFLTVHVKLEDVSGQGAAIWLRADRERDLDGMPDTLVNSESLYTLNGTADWQEVSVQLEDQGPDIRLLTSYLVLLPETSGTVYFDDAFLHNSEWAPDRSLLNGGFETGQENPGAWWLGGPGYSETDFGWSQSESWEGSRATSLSRTQLSEEDYAFWAQTLQAEDFIGGPATLRVRIKTELEGWGVSLAVRADDTWRPSGYAEAFVTTQRETVITGTRDWTDYTLSLDQVPEGMESLTVYLVYLPQTTGPVYFDGVSLTGR